MTSCGVMRTGNARIPWRRNSPRRTALHSVASGDGRAPVPPGLHRLGFMCLFLHRAGRRMRAHGPMSKRTRQRRRSKYVATQVARSKARQRAKADEYYLTFAKKKSRCLECGRNIKQRQELVYRHSPRHVLHKRCADKRAVDYRPSYRYSKWQAKADIQRRKRGQQGLGPLAA